MVMEVTLAELWGYLLQVGSLGGLVGILSLAYTILLNRVSLRIDVECERVDREHGLIDLSIRVRNKSLGRDTSIESFYIASTSLPVHEHFWSLRLLTLFQASSITEVIFDRKEALEKIQAVGRNIRIRKGATRNFRVLFSRPHRQEYSQMRFEREWHRYWPVKLVVETSHKDLVIPIIQPHLSRRAADEVATWFF